MNLPKMIFNELNDQDCFGLKVLINGFDPNYVAKYPKRAKEKKEQHELNEFGKFDFK